jgi:hypothetical protein
MWTPRVIKPAHMHAYKLFQLQNVPIVVDNTHIDFRPTFFVTQRHANSSFIKTDNEKAFLLLLPF